MAARFWVGGTGNWDASTTTNWSASTGGTGGQSVPTSSDDVTFDGSSGGGTVTVTATANCLSLTGGAFTGTLNTNGQTVNCTNNFNFSGSGTRTLTLGASTLNVGGWGLSTTTGLTFNANTSSIVISGSSLGFSPGSLTYSTVSVTLTSSQNFTLNGIGSGVNFTTLTFTGPSGGKTQAWLLPGNVTVSGTLTINGNSAINRLLFQSDTVGTPRTISAGTIVTQYTDWQDITAAGTANWNLTSQSVNSSGDCKGNSGITFTSPSTQHWTNASSGNWSTVGNWTSRIPLPQDTVILDKAFGTSQTVTADMPRLGVSVDFTGATWTTGLTFTASGGNTIFGSLTLLSGMTASGNNVAMTFLNRSTTTFTSAGVSIPWELLFNSVGATILTDGFTQTQAFGIVMNNTCTLDVQNNNVSMDNFSMNGSTTINMGSGIWTMSGTAGFNLGSAATVNASTSTVKYTNTSNTATSFCISLGSGAGKTFNNIWFSRGASTAANTLAGSHTFNDFKDDGSGNHSLLFTAGTTTTVTTFTMLNTSNTITINSAASSTSTHALTKTGYGAINTDFLNIQHSVATPSATWFTGVNSVSNQGVSTAGSGWVFATSGIADFDSEAVTENIAMAGTIFINPGQVVGMLLVNNAP